MCVYLWVNGARLGLRTTITITHQIAQPTAAMIFILAIALNTAKKWNKKDADAHVAHIPSKRWPGFLLHSEKFIKLLSI